MSDFPIRLAPFDGEILSSYLCRLSAQLDESVYECGSIWANSKALLCRDLDREVGTVSQRAVLAFGAISSVDVHSLTLNRWMRVLTPPSYRKGVDAAITPWINCVGVFHRKRLRHGLLYCPLCLKDSLGALKRWRLSFVTRCPRHGCALLDACPTCDAPYVPHRATKSGQCAFCSEKLWLTSFRREPSRRLSELDEFLSNELESRAEAGDFSEMLWEARILFSLMAMSRNRNRAAAESQPRLLAECSRLKDRLSILAKLADLLADRPNSIQAVASTSGWTKRTFTHFMDIPSDLDHVIDSLPVGQKRVRRHQVSGFHKRLLNLSRSHPSGWRVSRASILLKQAKGED